MAAERALRLVAGVALSVVLMAAAGDGAPGDRPVSGRASGARSSGAGPAAGDQAWWVRLALPGESVSRLFLTTNQLAEQEPVLWAVHRRAGSGEVATQLSPTGAAVAERAFSPAAFLVGLGGTKSGGAAGDHWTVAAGRLAYRSGSRSSGTALDVSDIRQVSPVVPGLDSAFVLDDHGILWHIPPDHHPVRALLLLPRDALHGPPRITALAGMWNEQFQCAGPLSTATYVATEGYGALANIDGGEEWRRAGQGLPDNVHDLVADCHAGAVYAATDDGVWVHHLRALPAPPVYAAPDLTAKRWQVAGVTALSVLLAVLLMLLMLRRGTAGA
jgi:hypothetical protein